jgi:acyl carrier protein
MNELTLTTPTARDALAKLICETLAKRMRRPVEELNLQTSFESLQMDSLDLAEMFFLLEEELKTTIPLDQGVKLQSIGDVLELVTNTLQEASLKTATSPQQ